MPSCGSPSRGSPSRSTRSGCRHRRIGRRRGRVCGRRRIRCERGCGCCGRGRRRRSHSKTLFDTLSRRNGRGVGRCGNRGAHAYEGRSVRARRWRAHRRRVRRRATPRPATPSASAPMALLHPCFQRVTSRGCCPARTTKHLKREDKYAGLKVGSNQSNQSIGECNGHVT